MNGWHTKQVGFVMAYVQADVENEMFIKIPMGLSIRGKKPKDNALKLDKNLYGKKQEGRVWYKH